MTVTQSNTAYELLDEGEAEDYDWVVFVDSEASYGENLPDVLRGVDQFVDYREDSGRELEAEVMIDAFEGRRKYGIASAGALEMNSGSEMPDNHVLVYDGEVDDGWHAENALYMSEGTHPGHLATVLFVLSGADEMLLRSLKPDIEPRDGFNEDYPIRVDERADQEIEDAVKSAQQLFQGTNSIEPSREMLRPESLTPQQAELE